MNVEMHWQAEKLRTSAYIAVVMACGFLAFYSLPGRIPFLVRLTTMVATQLVVGKALRRGERRHER